MTKTQAQVPLHEIRKSDINEESLYKATRSRSLM